MAAPPSGGKKWMLKPRERLPEGPPQAFFMKRSISPPITLAAVLLFFYAPIAVLAVNSFNASRFGGEWKGFTWSWYEKLWEAEDIWSALWISLEIAVLASLAAMVLGTLA